MRKYWLLLSSLFVMTCCIGQTLRFSMPDTTAAPGETIGIPIRVINFDSIVSVQFSLTWDVDVLEYLSNTEADLENVAVGDFQADAGQLRFSWFNQEGTSRSLPDGSHFIELSFNAIGALGDSTFLVIGDDPLPIQIAKATEVEGIFDLITPEQDTGLVRIGSALGISIVPDPPTCFDDTDGSISLSINQDTSQLTAQWTGPNGFTATGFSLNNLASGIYSVTILDNDNNVLESLEVNLIVEEVGADIISIDTDCILPTGSITATGQGGTAPYAYFLDGTPSPDGSFDNLAQGSYGLLVQDANGCIYTETVEVLSPQSPDLELGPTQFLCDSVRLAANVEGSYQWSTGSSDSTILVTAIGTYSLTVTNSFGCAAIDEVTVEPGENLNVSLQNDFLEFCPGDSIELVALGASTYQWIGGDNILSATDIANPIAFPDSSVELSLIASTSCATDTLMVPLEVFEITATAGPDTCIAPGESVQLMASGGIFYEWEEAPFPISDRSVGNPIVIEPSDSATYRVAITDINGCVTQDEVVVLIANDPALSILAINLITPNGDGKNDVLEFFGADKFGTNSLKVYNRWGNLLYQKVDYQFDDERFDGTYQGEDLPAGTYYYVLSFRSGDIRQALTIVRD